AGPSGPAYPTTSPLKGAEDSPISFALTAPAALGDVSMFLSLVRRVAHGSKARRSPPRRGPTPGPPLEALEDRTLPSTFLVTNTNDSGAGSLRQAILDANATPNVGGPDLISFNIPGAGVAVIGPNNRIQGNAIFSNGGLGIDLGGDGVT